MKKSPVRQKEIKIFCDINRCLACKSCEIACGVEHSKDKDLNKIVISKKEVSPVKRVRVSVIKPDLKTTTDKGVVSVIQQKAISIHCKHCSDAPCVTACMSGAMYKDKETNATLHNKDKCVGCWMCVMVCPFGAIMRITEEKIIAKCDLCPDREDYACVSACPTGALFVGTEEEFNRLLKKRKT